LFCFYQNNENFRVEFKEKIDFKPGTVLRYTPEPSTLENDQAKIRRCTTIDEINHQSDLLLQKLNELKKDKLVNKRDISGEYDELKIKFALVKEMKEKIMLKLNSNLLN
jgi:hypothetical protein